DRTAAEQVVRSLEQAGVRCWIALRDIQPGRTWAESIVEAITGSRIMVVVFSASADKSQQVVREMEQAVKHNLPVVAFRIENVRPSGAMDFYLSATQWLDAHDGRVEDYLPQLVQVLEECVRDLGS